MRRTVKDHSGSDLRPKVPDLELNLYHWSPSSNKQNINRYGLRVGQRSLQGDWRPPYVCFSDDAYLAWILSGAMWPEIESWDLWQCNFESQTSFNHYEIILDTYRDSGRHYIKEYRIYSRVYKRDLIYLGSRTN